MLDALKPTKIDSRRSEIVPGSGYISIHIHHVSYPDAAIGVEAFGGEVVVNYGEEHEHFDIEHQSALFGIGPFAEGDLTTQVTAFLRELMSGRVELHVTHRLIYVKTLGFWINEEGERERFISGGTLIPTLRWSKQPNIKTFDFG